ncbi:MAG: hydrolase [Kaistia sp. SCN 65-12]|uniref:HAD family hydrolase n=1 Tax=unclassified Nitrobacter TaxID=2620411 RepID=UPI00086E618F|nr:MULTISPECIES: HAD family hydrolase [unclassified Nitrobacter]MBN9149739.1 HAD family phosphatase [Nitrobacter sp.]ODT10941.1 MAG: hydrolase [Kaistia sp. SCN 65-12]OJV00213.1 MAG: hydrolase [Nitrobacter sp. 62-23]
MSRISLVISDVDGTLVTPDKRLTEAAINAVKALDENNIGFTITSSRPAFGMRMLVEPLSLKLPLGAFNGSLIVDPTLDVIQRTTISTSAARIAINALEASGIDIWLFTADRWLITRDDGRYVPHEQRTIRMNPDIASDLEEFTAAACKIVGVSADPDKLARCEIDMQAALAGQAAAFRSQSYYLDITPFGKDKGTFVEAMANRLGISPRNVATIGDMQNDLAMFGKSGLSFAMGNANDEVKAKATCVTDTNENDGFAKAIDRIIAGA